MTYAFDPGSLVERHYVASGQTVAAGATLNIADGSYIDVSEFEFALVLVNCTANTGVTSVSVTALGCDTQTSPTKTPISGVNVKPNPYVFTPVAAESFASEFRLHGTNDGLLDIEVSATGGTSCVLDITVVLFRPHDSRQLPVMETGVAEVGIS